MSKQPTGDERHRQYVQSVRVAATLLDGPRTLEEITDRSYGYLKALGLFRIGERQVRDQAASVRGRLEELIERGWIIREGERQALDFNRIAAAGAMGLVQQQPHVDELIERCLAELFQRGRLAGEDRLTVTDLGKKHLGH